MVIHQESLHVIDITLIMNQYVVYLFLLFMNDAALEFSMLKNVIKNLCRHQLHDNGLSSIIINYK